MKKWLLCLGLLLNGCKNSYIVKRNPESDIIKIGLVVSEEDKSIIEGLNLNVQFTYVCNLDCMSRFEDLEDDYVDGIVLIGDNVIDSFELFENKNHIPTISVYKQDELNALKKMYPEYKTWEYVTSEIVDNEADAYYIEEGIEIEIDQPFYQKNNSQSICTLVEDKDQFQEDLNECIDAFINEDNTHSIFYIEWIKK